MKFCSRAWRHARPARLSEVHDGRAALLDWHVQTLSQRVCNSRRRCDIFLIAVSRNAVGCVGDALHEVMASLGRCINELVGSLLGSFWRFWHALGVDVILENIEAEL